MNRSIAKKQLRVAKTMKNRRKKGTKHITSKIAKVSYLSYQVDRAAFTFVEHEVNELNE